MAGSLGNDGESRIAELEAELAEARLEIERYRAAQEEAEREREKAVDLDLALKQLQEAQHILVTHQETVVRKERLAAIGELAASVGHELRNPLAAARNAQCLVARFVGKTDAVEKEPRIAEFLALIDRELEACLKIVSDMLDFTRDRPLSLAPCPMRELVTEALTTLRMADGVVVVNEVPPDLVAPSLDRSMIRQVLINLMQNGIEAIPAGRTGRVNVAAEACDDGVVLSVTDDGDGVPDAVLPRVFEPLFTTKMKGTGLGLAVSASIVRQHGGAISVENVVGAGARFLVRLPGRTAEAGVAS